MPRDADSDGRTQEADQAQIENTRRLFCREVIAGNGAALQDEFYIFEDGRVFERIAVDGDDVGEISGFNCAGFHADEIGCVDGGGLDSVDRLHAPLDHFAELFGVVPVRVDSRIRAKCHFCTGLKSVAKILPLQAAPGDSVVMTPERDMGDPAQLSEFIAWAKQNYPAEKYALILASHGD